MNCILFDTPAPFVLKPNDERLKHIRQCLKTPEGGEVWTGRIGEFTAVSKLFSTADGGAVLTPVRVLPNPPQLNLTFCAAFARPQIAKKILFEAACFGVKNLVFYAAEKGDCSYEKSSLYASGEFRRYFVEGAQQACTAFLPNFFTAKNLEECLSISAKLEPENSDGNVPDKKPFAKILRIAPDPYEFTAHFSEAALQAKKTAADTGRLATITIGGERGFDNAERGLLRKSGYLLASLGQRILRTETAAIASLSVFALSQI